MAAMVLSSVGAFAQQAAGTTTLQPKVGLNVATIGDNDWKAGFAAGAELQYQAAISIAKNLRSQGLLTEKEYAVIDTNLQAAFSPSLGTLLSENDLIN